MADHNPPWHGRGVQNLPANANSPLSPASTGGATPSFERNVNRQKTQRWVQAKQYSYDGGDWGDDDDEEEEDERPAAPAPPYATHKTGSTSELSSGRLSGLGYGTDEVRASPTAETKPLPSAGDQKSLPFVRPADIYKRMREERTPVGEAASLGRSAEPQGSVQPRPTPTHPAVTGGNGTLPVNPSASKETTQKVPSIALPELKRMSGFGAEFLGTTDPSFQPSASSESAEASLHHNPSQASQASQDSQGFTSVVHQAFDVPETPNSTDDSVVRSNSDGTSVISPIISHRTTQDDKTPTIPEEPAESSTPTNAPKEGGDQTSFFKPGHRRDMSLPESDNSPSKRPLITDNQVPFAGQAELSSVSPGQSGSPDRPADAPGAQSASIPSTTTAETFIAPLKFGSNGTIASEGYRGEIPTIIPASAGDSPQDTDNDRLREEIMRSLSRENSQEPESLPQPNQDGSIPQTYEKYWDNSTGPGPDEVPRALVSETHPDWTSTHPLAAQDPYAATQTPSETVPPADADPKRPRLGRRFSWESASSDEAPATQVPVADAVAPSLDANADARKAGTIADDFEPMAEDLSRERPVTAGEISDDSQRIEKPRLSIVPPIPQTISLPQQIAGPDGGQVAEREVPLPIVTSKVEEGKLQGFRDILNKTSPAERIRAFDQTRDQFATLDTGIKAWLEFTVHAHPEHADLVHSSQSLSSGFQRTSPTTRKFPKLASLGNLTSKEDGAPAGAGHARRPSGHIGTIVTRQNVEQRGKDLLHTAGTFSGKAGEAAKGLFAKGRSKFRPSGDKVDQSTSSTPRRSLQLQFSSLSASGNSNSSDGNFSLRNSVVFGSLPLFKSSRNDNISAAPATTMDPASSLEGSVDDECAGKRLKSNGSVDLMRSVDKVDRNLPSQTTKTSGFDRDRSGGLPRQAEFSFDFEQEMNAALGLSPAEPRPQQASTFEPRLSPSATVATHSDSPQRQPEDVLKKNTSRSATWDPTGGEPNEKSLPDLPSQSSTLSPVSNMGDASLPGIPASEATVPLTRPVAEEEGNRISSPKRRLSIGHSSQDVPVKDILPDVPPRDVSNTNEDAPSLPPKDLSPRDDPLKGLLSLESGFTPRQPSVSTLGIDEHQVSHSPEEEVEAPPSPLQQPINPMTEAGDDESERHVSNQVDSRARTSVFTLPSLDDVASGFGSAYPSRPPSSAEILESKRRSISGLPPTTPGVQSPLRNEVRYSPGTRSSMLSFGSFGRQSNNSKGTRPNTPANEMSQQAVSGDSKMDKLKNFGRRRRASVGNALSGFQEGVSKEFQSLQARSAQTEPQQKDGGQKKRPFSRISGFFGRQQDPQSAQSKTLDISHGGPTPAKAQPPAPMVSQAQDSLRHNGHSTLDPVGKDLPPRPVSRSSSSSVESPSQRRDPRQRASMPIPPVVATTSMLTGRFYSSPQSGEPSAPSHHTRTKSQPMLSPPLLSPIGGSDSGNSGQSPPLSDVNQVEESTSPQEHHHEDVQPPVPPKSIEVQPKLEPSPGLSNDVSSLSIVPTHPHRSDARMVNDTPEPVELAVTHDDSSEEIIMSPTSYPGQEWTPTNYY
ncbi:hypothetical protein PMG11_05697 [Penicillium brasilianum]|uniref:Uncharacterized protein n=1 Tax=Penicillium brasilianum TaxID=104259 RepID=A0A0F7TPW1_PENBI|nr:hypothetical protein PMG11_05697 [Penicillium brasilianum]